MLSFLEDFGLNVRNNVGSAGVVSSLLRSGLRLINNGVDGKP